MAQREKSVTVRVSQHERSLLAAIAAHLERNESDTLRFLMRDAARRLGVHDGEQTNPDTHRTLQTIGAYATSVRP